MIRHFLDLDSMSPDHLKLIIEEAKKLKKAPPGDKPLSGKALAMIFEKPSTRTRVSFELAMKKLGGEAVVLERESSQLGRGETIADTARVLSGYVDCVMLRTTKEKKLLELAENATIPVINGLTDKTHPCQLMADILTYEERLGPIKDATIAWVGDGNNMASSWIQAAVRFNFKLNIACPPHLLPPREILDWAHEEKGRIEIIPDIQQAVTKVDCIVTDTWVSMGDEDTTDRREALAKFCVDDALMSLAASHAIFLHCLPAHRGEEVTSAVIDGPQSAVWQEAANRLPAQQAILLWCMGIL